MLGGLLRLGLDEELAVKADLLCVVDRHVHEAGQVVEFAAHVGVQQRLVSFPASPEDVVGASETLGDLHRLLHLCRGVREHRGVGVRRGARHESWVAEHVARAPEQLHSCVALELCREIHDRVQPLVRLSQAVRLRRDVAVVEAVEAHAELGEELECGAHGVFRRGHFVLASVGPQHGRRAEGVCARALEGVPERDREPQMLSHLPAAHDLLGIVVLERQGVL